MQVEDLIDVERELGFRYEMAGRRPTLPAGLPALPAGAASAWPRARCGERRDATARRERSVDEHGDAPGRRTADHRRASARTCRSMTGARLSTGVEPDRLVKTHCCFCGQQCGIQLKVKDNAGHRLRAVGGLPVQPRHALPQGRQALPAGLAPRPAADRASRATRRRPAGFARCRTTRRSRASRRRSTASSRAYGPGAFAVLGGASLTTEKTYLLGKFARVCLKTPNIDYNGRLCMVSAGAGEQEGVRHRPRRQPVVRHARRRGHLDRRRERRRVLADHHQLRLAGARARREDHRRDPRITPIARTCDLFLPVKPGRDAALFAGVLHLMIEHDWLDHDVHRAAHRRLRAGRRALPRSGRRARTAEVTGIPERAIRQAAEWWGTAKTSFLMHARGIEHHSQRRAELPRRDQPRAGLRPDRPPKLRLRHDHRPGQRPGRPRARPEVRPAARRARHQQPRASARTSPASGASTSASCRAPASTPTRCSARSTAARSRACCRSASTRRSRCPTTRSSRACWRSSSSSSPSTSS